MDYRGLGKTSLQVSSIGMGCVTFGREIDEETAFGVMDHAIGKGITLFDTAEVYAAGASEQALGNWIGSRGTRDDIVLATKVAGDDLTADRVVASAEESLGRLGVDTIDLFQVHNWTDAVPVDDTMGGLNRLVEQGKARYVGCSNYDGAQLKQALNACEAGGFARLESVQPNYNLVTREIEGDVLPLCEEREIGVISYSPLGAGFLTGKYRKGGEVPAGTRFDVIPGHQDIYFNDENFDRMEKLRVVSEREGRSMIQLALAWVIGQPGISSVLVGARSLGHIDQAFEAEATGLSEDLRNELSGL